MSAVRGTRNTREEFEIGLRCCRSCALHLPTAQDSMGGQQSLDYGIRQNRERRSRLSCVGEGRPCSWGPHVIQAGRFRPVVGPGVAAAGGKCSWVLAGRLTKYSSFSGALCKVPRREGRQWTVNGSLGHRLRWLCGRAFRPSSVLNRTHFEPFG